MKGTFVILFSLFYSCSFSQIDTLPVHSVEDAVNYSVKKFREQLGTESAIIYLHIETIPDYEKLSVGNSDIFLKKKIDISYFSSGTRRYLMEFRISIVGNCAYITVIKWRLRWKSRKNIEMIDLSTREYFKVEASQ